jgi:glycosyltransferase involved in cell wall biosynthesis
MRIESYHHLFTLAHFFRDAGFKIEIIPNALDLSMYPFKKRAVIQPRILWVRAFDKIYNPVLAIKSLRLVLDQFPSASLTMVGPVKDSSYEKCVEYVKQYQLEKAVNFRGLLNRDQWIEESSDFDIFINTTTIDNQPVSLLEAMALGFLVISTKVGGIPFLIDQDKNGFLFPSNDEKALADQILVLLAMSEEMRGEVSSRAREFAEQFDWQRIESKWLALLL